MEKERRITMKTLAMENIRRKPVRSFVLIIFIMVFTFVLVLGSLTSISLSNGIESLSNRLGADVMVVPAGHEARIDDVLLSGDPSEFYLPKGSLERLEGFEGIKEMSPQTYIATLSASCCSAPLQIMGIDYQSDFIIKPWLQDTLETDLRDGQVIVGNRVQGEVGQSLKFFGKPFKVVGKLEKTGMGFDASVFMTQKTAADLAIDAERKKKHPLSEDGSLVSVIMVKLEPGYDSAKVARKITKAYSDNGMYGMFSKKFVNSVSSNLSVVSSYISITIFVLWIMAVIVISMVFAMIFNERKKEMAVLRVVGSSKKQLRNMVLAEAFILSFFASILGTGLALLGLVIIRPSVVKTLEIPFLLPSTVDTILIVIICFVIGTIVGPLASLFTVRKVNKYDIYSSLRED